MQYSSQNTIIREFKQQRFWATHINQKKLFFPFTKFVLLSVFTLIEMIC